jgi:branched-chain amino acid transport system ATP-binding protein
MLLKVQNLYVSYAGCKALRGASIEVAQGEVVGLCGPNKAGKSTLCRCLAGTKKSGAGTITFDGRDITNLSITRRLPLGISLCPEGRGIYPGMSVLDNLKLGCDGVSRGEQNLRMEQVFSYFPFLSERLWQQAGTLSGGEAQMLGIARKLLRQPRLIIVDEPSLGLAPVAIDVVFKALLKVRQESGASVLVVEEGLALLGDWVDRAYVLNLGTVVAEGNPDTLSRSLAVAAAFTGEVNAITTKETATGKRD